MAASRLPGKPLLKINNLSIISHVFKRAESAKIGEVIVAAEDKEIVNDVKGNGGNAILTSKNHKTGTDRIFEALNLLNKKDEKHELYPLEVNYCSKCHNCQLLILIPQYLNSLSLPEV